MIRRIIAKKKKFLPYKNLGELYVESVKGQPPITRHAYSMPVKEMSKTAVTRDIISKNSFDLKAGNSKHGDIRLLPLQKGITAKLDTPEEQIQALLKAGYNVTKTIPPKAPGSRSSKFVTHVVVDKDGVEHFIVFGVGSNKGEDYEKETLTKIAQAIGSGAENEIINAIKYYLPGVQITDVKAGFGRRVVRPLDIEPSDVGEAVSDLTLLDQNNEPIYISLKNINGKTISNQGVQGAFDLKDGRLIYKPENNIVLDLLFEMLKVDIPKMVKGFNDYITQTVTESNPTQVIEIEEFISKNLVSIIGSAIGYGYYYAREETTGKIRVTDLTTPEKLFQFIGDITDITLQYPYFKTESNRGRSKSMAIVINTNRHKFAFHVRNNSGGIVPNVINLIKL